MVGVRKKGGNDGDGAMMKSSEMDTKVRFGIAFIKIMRIVSVSTKC